MSNMQPAVFPADELVGMSITGYERKALSLGIAMQASEIPDNDCIIFANIFRMLSDLDRDYKLVASDVARRILHYEARRLLIDLETMYVQNYAVKKFRRELGRR